MLTSKLVEANNKAWQIFGPVADAVVAISSSEIKKRLSERIGTGVVRTKHNMLNGRLTAFAVLDDKLSVFVTEDVSGSDLVELKWRMGFVEPAARVSA